MREEVIIPFLEDDMENILVRYREDRNTRSPFAYLIIHTRISSLFNFNTESVLDIVDSVGLTLLSGCDTRVEFRTDVWV